MTSSFNFGDYLIRNEISLKKQKVIGVKIKERKGVDLELRCTIDHHKDLRLGFYPPS